MLRLVPGFLPPRVSGDGDAGGAVVLQRLQGGEEAPLQADCLGQTRQLQVRWELLPQSRDRHIFEVFLKGMVRLHLAEQNWCLFFLPLQMFMDTDGYGREKK